MHISRGRAAAGLAAAIAWLCAPAPGEAQYFGRNTGRYETLAFEVLKTEHFDIYYYPQERVAVGHAGRMAERWYARLSRLLGHQLVQRQPIVLYETHAHFRQTNTLGGE